MKANLPIAVLLLSFTAQLVGVEYRIQAHRPAKAGQEFRLFCQAQQNIKTSITAGQTALPTQRTNLTLEAETQVKVLKADSKGRITEATATFASLVRIEGRERTELLPAGTTVRAALVNEREQFSVSGKTVEAETQIALSLVLPLQRQQGVEQDAFGSDTPKKIGDSWEVKVEPLAATLKNLNMGIEEEDLRGQVTLEGLSKVGDIECLDLTAKVYIKKMSPTLPAGLTIKRFFGSVRWAAKLPLDLALGVLEESTEMSLDFSAEGKSPAGGVAANVASSVAFKRTAKMSYSK